MRPFCLALIILLLKSSVPAQQVHIPSAYSAVKVENGLIIGWKVTSKDSTARQIDVYDRDGNLLVGLTPLRFVPEARDDSISDVSALPGQVIVVAAVFSKGNAFVPAASLLYFDFQGRLLQSLALDPSREVKRVTVDAESNVWTLTEGPGGQKPSDAPMIVGYRLSGRPFKELFRRSEFPIHASLTQENADVGVPGFGQTSDRIWFWLPGSADLVTFKPDGSSIKRETTNLPRESPHESTMKVLLTDEGALVVEIMGGQEPGRGHLGFFLRSATTPRWEPFYPTCPDPCILVGVDRGTLLFAKGLGTGSLQIEAGPMP
jgi:hypothetical protein